MVLTAALFHYDISAYEGILNTVPAMVYALHYDRQIFRCYIFISSMLKLYVLSEVLQSIMIPDMKRETG